VGHRGTVKAGDYIFYGKGNDNITKWEIFYHTEYYRQLRKFFTDRMLYIVRRSRWCNIVQNAYVPSEEKTEDSKGNFYEEFEKVFYHFPKYHI
jgi:hypothetical protein